MSFHFEAMSPGFSLAARKGNSKANSLQLTLTLIRNHLKLQKASDNSKDHLTYWKVCEEVNILGFTSLTNEVLLQHFPLSL